MLVTKGEKVHLEQIMVIWKEFMDHHALVDPYYIRTEDGHIRFAEFLEMKMTEERSLVLVASEGESVLGYCLSYIHQRPPVFVERDIGIISDLAVRKDCRRGGVGEALLERSLEWLREKGMKRVELRTSARNEMAIEFYRKHGFRVYDHEMTLEL